MREDVVNLPAVRIDVAPAIPESVTICTRAPTLYFTLYQPVKLKRKYIKSFITLYTPVYRVHIDCYRHHIKLSQTVNRVLGCTEEPMSSEPNQFGTRLGTVPNCSELTPPWEALRITKNNPNNNRY